MQGRHLQASSRLACAFVLIWGAACSERPHVPPSQPAPAQGPSDSTRPRGATPNPEGAAADESLATPEGQTGAEPAPDSKGTSKGETGVKDGSADHDGPADASRDRQALPSWKCAEGEPVSSDDRIDVSWKTGGALGVVRVRLDDVLNIRSGAGNKSAVVGTVPPTATALQPTGAACQIGRTIWYQVQWQGDTGWVSGKFVERLTTKHDFTEYFREQGATHQAATPEAWARELVQQFNARFRKQPEGNLEMRLLGTRRQDKTADVVVHTCCELDDSVAGRQSTLHLVKTATGWKMKQADGRYVCYRGTSGEFCI